jgi:hypothetical protein
MDSQMKNGPSLGVILCGGLLVWAIACFCLHGSAILMYIGMQAITSGVFAYEMCRIEKSMQKPRTAPVADSPARK